MTVAPSARKRSVIANPLPLAPPVTIAMRPLSRSIEQVLRESGPRADRQPGSEVEEVQGVGVEHQLDGLPRRRAGPGVQTGNDPRTTLRDRDSLLVGRRVTGLPERDRL